MGFPWRLVGVAGYFLSPMEFFLLPLFLCCCCPSCGPTVTVSPPDCSERRLVPPAEQGALLCCSTPEARAVPGALVPSLFPLPYPSPPPPPLSPPPPQPEVDCANSHLHLVCSHLVKGLSVYRPQEKVEVFVLVSCVDQERVKQVMGRVWQVRCVSVLWYPQEFWGFLMIQMALK